MTILPASAAMPLQLERFQPGPSCVRVPLVSSFVRGDPVSYYAMMSAPDAVCVAVAAEYSKQPRVAISTDGGRNFSGWWARTEIHPDTQLPQWNAWQKTTDEKRQKARLEFRVPSFFRKNMIAAPFYWGILKFLEKEGTVRSHYAGFSRQLYRHGTNKESFNTTSIQQAQFHQNFAGFVPPGNCQLELDQAHRMCESAKDLVATSVQHLDHAQQLSHFAAVAYLFWEAAKIYALFEKNGRAKSCFKKALAIFNKADEFIFREEITNLERSLKKIERMKK